MLCISKFNDSYTTQIGFCELAKVIIILVLASEKLMEMANFVSVSEIPLFENNTYYVKYMIEQSSLSIKTKQLLKTLNFQLTLNTQLSTKKYSSQSPHKPPHPPLHYDGS